MSSIGIPASAARLRALHAATLFSFERRPSPRVPPLSRRRALELEHRAAAQATRKRSVRAATRRDSCQVSPTLGSATECRYAGANLENYIAAKVINKIKILRANGGCLGARSR